MALKGFQMGCQFVMNHFHTFDIGSLIYESFFLQSGGKKSGYVLKPSHLRSNLSKIQENIISDPK
jgi:hypothetical protein